MSGEPVSERHRDQIEQFESLKTELQAAYVNKLAPADAEVYDVAKTFDVSKTFDGLPADISADIPADSLLLPAPVPTKKRGSAGPAQGNKKRARTTTVAV